MASAAVVSRADPTRYGPSYVALRERGIALLQQLAGEIWTDYNEHDPGVTLLEQLVYALTDVAYRAGVPLVDLLVGPDGTVDLRRHALTPALEALPCAPLTPADYRRLIADRITAVGNVWITPLPRATGPEAVNGLFEIEIYAPNAHPAEVREQVFRVYAAHRNLCEDLRAVRVLAHVPTVVHAVVTVDDHRAPEIILAELCFHLGRFLAPEIRREPLDALLALELPPSAIFAGPLLHDGFIDDAELRPRSTRVRVPDLARLIARTSGVLGVRDVSVHTAAGDEARGAGEIAVPPRSVLTLAAPPFPSLGDFPLQLVRRGSTCRVDAALVRHELDRLWAEHRRRYPLSRSYEARFGAPEGRKRELATYTSIQNELPAVYGISAFGLPDEANPMRRAQAKQLKGYLIAFEQLLADFFAQLAQVRNLYAIERPGTPTYAHGALFASVPDASQVLGPDYGEALAGALREMDPAIDRRDRFLDLLLGLHADGLAPEATHGHRGRHALGDAKAELLEHLVRVQRDRARGIDARAKPSSHELTAMELRTRIELGLPLREHRSLVESLAAVGLELVTEISVVDQGKVIEEHFTAVAVLVERATSTEGARAHGRIPVTESVLVAAIDLENLRVGRLPGEEAVSLLCRVGEEEHHHLGRYADVGTAVAAALELEALCLGLRGHGRQLYLVDHMLLRFGRHLTGAGYGCHPGHDEEHGAFAYSFTVSAVLSHGLEDHPAFERAARAALRRNAPAHVHVECHFLRPAAMHRFEELHHAWREALHHRRLRDLIYATTRLRRFLEWHEHPA